MYAAEAKKRACDGCRIRKRKCDGVLPFCTNCQKATVKGPDGMPICTYSMAIKKRGPKKGYKENLLQRLETLEAVLSPFEKSNSASDTSNVNNLALETEWQVSAEESRHSDSLDYVADQAILAATQTIQIQNQHSPPQSHYESEFTITHSAPPSLQSSPALSLTSLNDEDIQLSLLRLGIQYCTTLNNFRLSLLLRENQDTSMIAPSLKLALCAHGLFYSKHPYLLNMLRMSANHNSPYPIHNLAEQYLEQAISQLPPRPAAEMELVDTVRSCMIISTGYFVIGNNAKGVLIKERMQKLIQEFHLFDPFLFNPTPSPTGFTSDYLMSDFSKRDQFVAPTLSDEELNERFSLWEEVMSIDTFFALVSGNDFDFDESMYPRGFNNPALDGTKQVDMDLNIAVSQSMTLARYGQNTIWANSPYAKAFDDMREMSAISSLYFTGGLVQYRLSIMRIGRRAIRFSRECEKGEAHRFPNDSHASIHEMFIKVLDNLPKSFMPFESLEKFAKEPSSTTCHNSKWVSHLSFYQDLLMFLASMTFIHVPEFKSNSLYNLSAASTNKFTSKDILVTLLRAAVSMITHLYSVSNFSGMVPGDNIPVPGLASNTASSSIYLIAAAALVASRDAGTPILKKEVDDLVTQWICPALQKIGIVKAMAARQADKLALLLQTLG